MTRIDFHSNVGDSLLYACRLIRKAYQAGQPTIVLAEPARLRAFDEPSWTFSPRPLRCRTAWRAQRSPRKRHCAGHESRRRTASSGAAQSRREGAGQFHASKGCWKWSVTHMKNSSRGREDLVFYRDRGYALNNYKQGS